MIRPYRQEDETALIAILKEPNGHYLSEYSLDFSGFQEVYVRESDKKIDGFLAIEICENRSQIICYVAPSKRKNGLGTQLFDYGKKRLEALDPNTIWLFFRNDVGDSSTFYKNRNAAPWYCYHYMETSKIDPTTVSLTVPPTTSLKLDYQSFDEVIPYHESYFEDYLENRADAFMTINQLIDSRPYDERERRDEIEKWTKKYKEKIWLFMADGELVGSLALFDGFFDELFVSKAHQNKGAGSEIVKWGLNLCAEKKWRQSLCVVTGNQAAIKLYERNGFTVKQTLEMNRLFSPNKEPDLRGPIGGA